MASPSIPPFAAGTTTVGSGAPLAPPVASTVAAGPPPTTAMPGWSSAPTPMGTTTPPLVAGITNVVPAPVNAQPTPPATVGGWVTSPATPARTPVALASTYFQGTEIRGNVFDATEYLQARLNLGPSDKLRVFHHARDLWATAGERTRISTWKSGGVYGKGLYTATVPETMYGQYELQLELPVSAFQGKKLMVAQGGSSKPDGMEMPPGVDILVVEHGYNNTTWFIFKPGSETWINRDATESDFDKPGQLPGWD